MQPPRTTSRHRAITLLEVVLSMGLLVLLASMTYWFYFSVLEARRGGTDEARRVRLVRVVMDRMAREITQASTIAAEGHVGIRGEPERIWLSTLRVPTSHVLALRSGQLEGTNGEYDVIKTEYKIVRHPEILDEEEGYEIPLGLARVEIDVPRPDSAATGEAFKDELQVVGSGEEADAAAEALFEDALLGNSPADNRADLGPDIEWAELYAPDIRYIRFCYFDGSKWWDDWDIGGTNPLPQLVMVVIGFEGHAPFGEEFGRSANDEFCECLGNDPVDCEPLPGDQYAMVVRVPQADPLFRSRIVREARGVTERMKADEAGSEGQ
ncbi:MAG: type II secretion system protein J [Phycisphaerae bacterium]